MSNEIINMEQLVNKLEEHFPDTKFTTVENVVDTIVDMSNSENVYAFDDNHLGLKNDLSPEFLNAFIADADSENFESDRNKVLEQAESTIELAERELSEENIEDIKEDCILRGVDPDDIDV